MPDSLFQKYIDRDYEDMQLSLSEISGRVIKLDTKLIKSDEEFISQLMMQVKSYAQLILELFDHIENIKAKEKAVLIDPNRGLVATPLSAKKGHEKENQFARNSFSGAFCNDTSFLEQKIEYLNAQLIKSQKQLEAKSLDFENLKAENVQLGDQNRLQIEDFKTALGRAEEDNKELLDINFQLKNKYKEIEAELFKKKKEMLELLEKIDPDYVEKLENEIERLKEQNEFSEKLEDIEKFKETIAEKEQAMEVLQQQLEAASKSGSTSSNIFEKLKEVTRAINRVIKQLNEILNKQEIAGTLNEIPQDVIEPDEEIDFLINRINSKLIDITDALRSINDSCLSKKQAIKERTSILSKQSPEKSRYETGSTADAIAFSQILEAAQNLRDQIEDGANPEILMAKSRTLFQDLLRYFHSIPKSEPGLDKRNSVQEPSNLNHGASFSNNVTRSPSKFFVRDAYLKAQEEISGHLRHSVTALQVSNMNELSQQLQLQMDRNTELENKFETIQKAFHSISLVINEEAARFLLSLEDLLALSEDNALFIKAKKNLSSFKAKIENLFSKQGNYYYPASEYVDALQQLKAQKSLWESALSSQRNSFADEIKKLEDSLRREEMTVKSEKELSAQTIARLEGDLKIFGLQKERLALENGRLQLAVKSEKASLEEVIKRNQQEYELERQSNTQKGTQLHELEKIVAEKEKNLSELTDSIGEWQIKYSKLEQEFITADKERNTLKKDKDFLKEKMIQNETIFKDLVTRVERMDNQSKQLMIERDELAKKVAEKDRIHDRDQEQIALELKRVQDEYRRHVEDTHISNSEFKQRYDKLVSDYLRQLDEQREAFEVYKAEKESEIRARTSEIKELTLRYQTAEELSRAQEINLARKDEKLSAFLHERNQLQEKITQLEREQKDVARIKEKNKKYVDLLSNANTEISQIKADFQSLVHEKRGYDQRAEALEKENQGLRANVEHLRENLGRITQKLHETVSESKELRLKFESEQQTNTRREKELKYMSESTSSQAKATINYKDDLIQRLKDDLIKLSNEHDSLRAQHQRVTERNQEITTELHSLRALVKEREGTFKEMEELDKFNDTLLQEMKEMRNDLKKKEDELLVTKKQFKQELHISHKKLKDVSTRLNCEESETIKNGLKKVSK